MNAEIFAEWLRRQGHKVIRSESSYWFNQGPRVYQSFPYHWLIEPSTEEIDQLFRSHHAIGLRYSTFSKASSGMKSYHVVFEGRGYLLESLPKKARYDVRKGLSMAVSEPVSFEYLAINGWQLRYETLKRQGRMKAEDQHGWEKLCRSVAGLPGFEAWGSRVDDRLAAAIITFRCEDCFSILYQQSLSEYMHFGVNNALVYEFTRYALNQSEISRIFYGLHSLDAPASVDEFKFRMGYVAKPVKQRVVFHPLIAPFFNQVSYRAIKQLSQWNRSNPTLAKMEGLVRFYLLGSKETKGQRVQ